MKSARKLKSLTSDRLAGSVRQTGPTFKDSRNRSNLKIHGSAAVLWTVVFFLSLFWGCASLANQPPEIVNQGVFHYFDGRPAAEIGVHLKDLETPAGNLTLQAFPSHPEILPREGVEISGTGAARTVKAEPAHPSKGLVRIDFTVRDLGGAESYSRATLVVNETEMAQKDPAAGDRGGSSVAAGKNFVAVGYPEADTAGDKSGSVVVFVPQGNEWKVSQVLNPAGHAAGRRFGASCAADGEFLVIGADGSGAWGLASGSVHLFRQNKTRWIEEATVTPADPQPGDLFGRSVSIRGMSIMVGAPGRNDCGEDSGAAYVFTRDKNGKWHQDAKLAPSSPRAKMAFGSAVSIWEETAAAGAPGSGTAFIFEKQGSQWLETTILKPADSLGAGGFGASLALRRDLMIVGAPGRQGTGSVTLVILEADGWTLSSETTPSDGTDGDLFGTSVVLSESHMAVGSPGNGEKGGASGAVYIHTFESGEALETFKITSADCVRGDLFGTSAAIFGANLAVGAPRHDAGAADTGGCYGYRLPDAEIPAVPAERVEAGPSDLFGRGKIFFYRVINDFDAMKSRFSGVTWFTLSFWAKARSFSAGPGKSVKGIPVAAFRICAGDLGPNGDGILRYWSDQKAEIAIIDETPIITPAAGLKSRNLAVRAGIAGGVKDPDSSGWARYFVTFPIDWADPPFTFAGCKDMKGFKPSVAHRSNWKGIVYLYSGSAVDRPSDDPKESSVLFDAVQLEASTKTPSEPSVYANRQNIDATPIK